MILLKYCFINNVTNNVTTCTSLGTAPRFVHLLLLAFESTPSNAKSSGAIELLRNGLSRWTVRTAIWPSMVPFRCSPWLALLATPRLLFLALPLKAEATKRHDGFGALRGSGRLKLKLPFLGLVNEL